MTQNGNTTPMASPAYQPSSRFIIVMAWIIVLFPAGWGIYLTAMRAAKLFR